MTLTAIIVANGDKKVKLSVIPSSDQIGLFGVITIVEDRKKILYVVTKSVWCGAQRYVFDLATSLPKDQFEATVVTGGSGPLVDRLEKHEIKTILLPALQKNTGLREAFFSLRNVRAFFKLISLFRNEHSGAIHLNSSIIGGIGGTAGFIYKLLDRRQTKIIFTAHGWPFKEHRPLPQKTAILFLTWLSTLFHDAVITIQTADFISARYFIPQRKVRLVFNGFDEASLLSKEEARKFLASFLPQVKNKDAFVVGAIAELTGNKGLEYLVDAVSRISSKNFYVMIIGDGEDRKKLEKKIKNSNLEDRVHLAGFIPEAKNYLAGFDIFALPSLKEGLPYAVMEAMHAGLPLVATKVGGVPDLVEHGKNGLLGEPKNHSFLAHAIGHLIDNKGEREKFGRNSREKIK